MPPPTDPDRPPGTVASIALSTPALLPATATVGEVRGFLAGGHVHLALLAEADRSLTTCVTHTDLGDATHLPDTAPARGLGTTTDRVVRAGDDAEEVAARMARDGVRRLVVVDDRGRVVGLVCRKRSGRGFCTDDGVTARRAEREADPTSARTPRS